MDKGKLILQQKKDDYYYVMKYFALFLGIFGLSGMMYLGARVIQVCYERGPPLDLFFWIGGVGGIICVSLILLYFCIFTGLCATQFRIYERGIVPYCVPLRYALKKGTYFIPWEKIIAATYIDYSTKTSPMGEAFGSFQKKLFGYTHADYCFYVLGVKKTSVFGVGKEKIVSIVINPIRLVGPKKEKITSSEILKILKEELKIEEKVKLIPFEEYVKIPGRSLIIES